MRLTEDQVRQALKHADGRVRHAALEYFSKSYSSNTRVMQDAIEVLESLGPQESFTYVSPLEDLAQTESTVAWAVERLSRPRISKEKDLCATLGRLLCSADPALVLPHKDALLSSPGLSVDSASRLKLRFELFSTPADLLWPRLQAIAKESDGNGAERASRDPLTEASEITEALARDGSNAARMLELLSVDVDPDDDTGLGWLEIFLVEMAGHMRHEPAIPLILKKLYIDVEFLNEACQKALTQIGTDAVIGAVRDQYLEAPGFVRLYTCAVFGDIHTDLAVSAGLELLPQETEPNHRAWLAAALVDQFSTEAIDAARLVLLENPDRELLNRVVVACKVTEHDIPELSEWEQEALKPATPFDLSTLFSPRLGSGANLAAWEDEDAEDYPDESPDRPSLPPRVTIGRNDPCPCGSGKKYKKCCLNKAQISL